MIYPVDFKTNYHGYGYLDVVSRFVLHSGQDFNKGFGDSDRGLPVRAIANGEVVFAKSTGKGWGDLVVIYFAGYGIWGRYAHLQNVKVKVGNKVKEGQQIAEIGKSGTKYAHLHFDIIKKELPYWTKYTKFWSEAKVKEYYANPLEYIQSIIDSEHKDDWKQEAEKWAVDAGITIGGRGDDAVTRYELWETFRKYSESRDKKENPASDNT